MTPEEQKKNYTPGAKTGAYGSPQIGYFDDWSQAETAAKNFQVTVPTTIPSNAVSTNGTFQGVVNSRNTKVNEALTSMGTLLKETPTSTKLSDYETYEDNVIKQYETDSNTLATKGAVQSQLESQYDISGKRRAVQDINNQMTTLNNSTTAEQIGLIGQGRGIPQEILNKNSDQLERMKTIKMLGLSSIANATQGNLQLAQQDIESQMKMKFGDIEQKIERSLKMLDLNDRRFNREEKKLADKLKGELEAKKLELDFLKDEQAQISKVMFEAAQLGAPQATLNKIMNASSLEEAIAASSATLSQPFIMQKEDRALNNRLKLEDQAMQQNAYSLKASGSGVIGRNSGVNNGGGNLSPLTQAVIDNPSLLTSLTNTEKGKVITELSRAGYDLDGLGVKPLSDTAIKEINQTNFALSSLNDLKVQVENNLKYIGPIRGLAALNPWSKARKVQSDVDRVRQTVGKALEGGVLRKEDEEKYKKILATLNDTPEVATYKINNLISSIQKNLVDYQTLQENSGKSLNVKSSLQKNGGVVPGKTSTGNGYTVTKQ